MTNIWVVPDARPQQAGQEEFAIRVVEEMKMMNMASLEIQWVSQCLYYNCSPCLSFSPYYFLPLGTPQNRLDSEQHRCVLLVATGVLKHLSLLVTKNLMIVVMI